MTNLALVEKIPYWDLIQRCQRRDEDAFGQLFGLFKTRVHKIALRILRDETAAEDATQETFLNVFRAIDRFRGESQITTWLSRIAINVCFEMIRKNSKFDQRKLEGLDSEIQNLATTETPYTAFCRHEQDKTLRAALGRLGKKHGAVVRMHDFEGLTIKEISDRLQITEGTVKSRLFYGRLAFKKSYVGRLKNAAISRRRAA